jgi:hypothetical protein
MGSENLLQAKQRPIDFPYQSSNNLVTMPGEKVVFRSIENDYDNFSQAIQETLKSREEILYQKALQS